MRDGLLAGALPLVAGLIVARVAPSSGAPLMSVWTAVCLGAAIPSGVWLGAHAAPGRMVRRVPSRWAAGFIAARGHYY